MRKLVWNNEGHAEWVVVTEEQDAERVELLKAVMEIPEIAEPEKVIDWFPAGDSGFCGKRTMYQIEKSFAEFYAEHDAQKEKRRKDRAGQKYRHRKPEDRHAHGERYGMSYKISFGKLECGNDRVRNMHREIGLRKDYELEYAELEEIREYNAFVKKCEDEFKKMEEESRKYAELKALEVWLQWA